MTTDTPTEIKPAAQPGIALRHGVIAAQARDFDRARVLLQQAITESPDDVIAWYWLAIASDSADAAIECLRRVLAIDAVHEPAREALSKLLVTEARAAATADRDKARALAAEAALLTPAAAGPRYAMAALATTHIERIDALRHLVALSPDDARLRTQLRQALLAHGVMVAGSDPAEARTRIREAATLNAADPRVWQLLADLAESRDEALHALRELLNVAPNHARGRTALRQALGEEALALIAAGQPQQACVYWREAITITGGDIESWLGLASATSDQDEATRAIETAYEFNPHHPHAIAAMERLRGIHVDPGTIAPPEDAFARFATAEGRPFELLDDPIDPADSLLDAFAKLEAAAVEAGPLPAVIEPAPAIVEASAACEAAAERPEPAVTPAEVVEPAAVAALTEVVASAELAAPAEVAASPEVAPLAEVAAPPEAAAPIDPPAAAARTVMIVDDSPTIRKILGLTLERAGYTVIAEPDGPAALQKLTQVIPGVVLLDIAMPTLDGYEVCKRIKEDARTANVPVIMLSGKGAFFDKVKGHLAGATEYLTKPFETPAVLAAVNAHCRPAMEAANG